MTSCLGTLMNPKLSSLTSPFNLGTSPELNVVDPLVQGRVLLMPRSVGSSTWVSDVDLSLFSNSSPASALTV